MVPDGTPKETAVSDSVDCVDHRRRRIAGPEGVGVERVSRQPACSSSRRDERLRGHLAAEEAPVARGLVGPAVDVEIDLLEIEHFQQIAEDVTHGKGVSTPGAQAAERREGYSVASNASPR